MTPALKPFFRYYGGKQRAARTYPAPMRDRVIEPFAGAAGYSMLHADRDVLLIDKYPVIAGIWRYLIAVSPSEIQRIPSVDSVNDLPAWVPQEARWLVGFWMNDGTTRPCVTLSSGLAGFRAAGHKTIGWGQHTKDRIAGQVDKIRHWRVIEGDYTEAPDVDATWFIDPPYAGKAGSYYVRGSKDLDYAALGAWCRARRGQVMVCEAAGADWLPFVQRQGIKAGFSKGASSEALWTNDVWGQLGMFGGAR